VEARLFPSALDDSASYGAMLQVLLALHEPLETRLAALGGFPALGVDLAGRRKAPHLRADLHVLEVPFPAAPRRSTPPVHDLATALGAFYVLEGSTLGGRMLLKQVHARLGAVPTQFLTGYGDETGRYWRHTRTALVHGVAADADPAAAADRLIAGATVTFEHLDGLLDDWGWPAQVPG
jgi:heme oxygenase